MEKMNDLRDLLKHEVMDLHSAEEQIIKALPAMIKKAKNAELKQSLQQHLKVTEAQLTRLQKVQKLLQNSTANSDEESGLLSRLFKRSYTCRGMQGIIDEGEKIMAEDMSPEVLDAAIIAASQKIEHYEICGYGTARAFAEELGLTEVATLLQQTLDEEYEADDKLTELAVNRLNQKAERKGGSSNRGNITSGNSRDSARPRVTREEPAMEMASNKRGAGSASRGNAQNGGNTRGAGSSSRSTGNVSGASSTRAAKTPVKSSSTRGNNSSGGRGNSSGRS